MTTTVTIRHEGPSAHKVLVEIVHETDGLLQEVIIDMGESFTTYLYGPQSIHVNELV